MNNKISVAYLFYIVIIVITLGYISDKITYKLLQPSSEDDPKIIANHKDDFKTLQECCAYNEIDPLLGWAMRKEHLQKKGYKVTHNCILLEQINTPNTDTLKIFITGGSTSDLGLDTNAYPKTLFYLLKEKHTNVQIYVAAVGAYASSQELLKLLRDGASIHPDIHISYNGVNETQNPYFVSSYEQVFFKNALFKNNTTPLLPHLIYYVRSKLGWIDSTVVLKPIPHTSPYSQWVNNMQTMQQLAVGGNYIFAGILQPAMGIGNIHYDGINKQIEPFVTSYRNFYPQALRHIPTTSYLYDGTKFMDSIGATAFKDDCHLKAEYQHIIARQILTIIEKLYP